MGRKLLADPHLPRKLKEGRADEVRPCVYCYSCVSAIYKRERMYCAVNPEWAGNICAGIRHRRRAPSVSWWWAVAQPGWRPHGASPASVMRLFYWRGRSTGWYAAFCRTGLPANERLLDWLCLQVDSMGIDVRLKTAATPELIASMAPDHVVVATGARRDLPPIPGSEQPQVFSGDDMRNLVLGMHSESVRRRPHCSRGLPPVSGPLPGFTANLGFVRKATRIWMPLGKKYRHRW